MRFAYMCTVSMMAKKKTLDHLELELQTFVSHQVGTGIKPTPSGKPACALNLLSHLFNPQIQCSVPDPVTKVLLTEQRVKDNPHT